MSWFIDLPEGCTGYGAGVMMVRSRAMKDVLAAVLEEYDRAQEDVFCSFAHAP